MEAGNVITIVSGGQTGVDRAALDTALRFGFNCTGWCPKGRIAEDGIISKKYPLKETDSSDYALRTKLNAADTDGTLILYLETPDKGTKQTIEYCKALKKPIFIQVLTEKYMIGQLLLWIKQNKIQHLNIAGPRESSAPGIYLKTIEYLSEVFRKTANIH